MENFFRFIKNKYLYISVLKNKMENFCFCWKKNV